MFKRLIPFSEQKLFITKMGLYTDEIMYLATDKQQEVNPFLRAKTLHNKDGLV